MPNASPPLGIDISHFAFSASFDHLGRQTAAKRENVLQLYDRILVHAGVYPVYRQTEQLTFEKQYDDISVPGGNIIPGEDCVEIC